MSIDQCDLEKFTNTSDMYLFCAIFLRFPTDEMVAKLADGSITFNVRQITEACGLNKRGQDSVRAALRIFVPTALSDLRSEYTRLFDHPDMPAVQRYEGLFRFFEEHPGRHTYEGAPLRFVNPAALDAERCYRKAGFERSPALNEPADSVSAELEFMSRLYEGKAQALREEDVEAVAFADECIGEFVRIHGRKWWVAFFEAVARESRIDFYRAVGLLGAVFVTAMLEEYASGTGDGS